MSRGGRRAPRGLRGRGSAGARGATWLGLGSGSGFGFEFGLGCVAPPPRVERVQLAASIAGVITSGHIRGDN